MGYKHFTFQVIIRLFLLLIVMASLVIGMIYYEYIKAFFILIIIVFQVVELSRFINKSNYDYINFLNALANRDYSTSFSISDKGESFKSLYQNFDKISKQFNALNFDREMQFRHLQTLIKHIDIGIISFNDQKKIHLVNDHLKDILESPFLNSNQPISKLKPEFLNVILSMKHGENRLFQLQSNKQTLELSLNVTDYTLKNKKYKLISVKNIHNELDKKEQESYQKLIRVLTHEIMNSVSPIVSLSSTLDQTLEHSNNINELKIDSLKEGIHAIHDRSRNLLNFTHEYRKLTKLPNPVFQKIDIKILIERINKLYIEDLKRDNIDFIISISKDIEFITADEGLLEQVLINIYKNAFEATINKEEAVIETNVFYGEDDSICYQIKDNGDGISHDKLSKVFIPFYTDKENGSGIGLSLCKQIMNLHGGRISIDSIKNKFTSVNLYFNEKKAHKI